MRKDAPLAVEVPASDRDKPGWVKVGVIAAVGFIVGIAWPRVMGIRLGPSAPGEAAAAAASASAAAGRAPDAPPASVVAKGPAAASAVASATAPPAPSAAVAAPASASASASAPTITIQKGSVLSCKTSDGDTKKGKDCGSVPGIDRLVQPRVRKLASCQGAAGQAGKLSLVFTADFRAHKLTYDIGKSSTLSNTDALGPCLKAAFDGVTTKDTPHDHQRYTVAYSAMFAAAGGGGGAALDDDKVASKGDKADKDRSERSAKGSSDDKDEASAPAEKPEKTEKANLPSGEAQVAWEVALVRDTPKTGGLVSRLPRGTKVKVGAAKDGWFQIKFGDGYAHEGWVYRGAIGR